MNASKNPEEHASSPQITTFLMFSGSQYGKAEEAIRFYVETFPDSKIEYVQRHGAGEQAPEGELRRGSFVLAGQHFLATESVGDFRFNSSFSLYVKCSSAEEANRLFTRLSGGGKVHMPLRSYPSSQLFAWFDDKYGVSWQLEIPKSDQ